MAPSRERSAWRTMNWLRFGQEVFMVQQKWHLYTETAKPRRTDSVSYDMESFPTDDWRIVNLKEVLGEDDLLKVLEARNE